MFARSCRLNSRTRNFTTQRVQLELEALEDRNVLSFSFPDFSSVADLQLNGSAGQAGDALRLAPSARRDVSGSAWLTAKQSVEDAFDSTFSFQIQGIADGLAFVIQNSSLSALGVSGGYLGYAGFDGAPGTGIANSLAVEFDIIRNGDDPGEPSSNHISVHTRGTQQNSRLEQYSIGAANVSSPDFNDGAVHQARISYANNSLRVFVDDLATPRLTVAVDLGALLALDAGKAFVGFTAGVGAQTANHDVLTWSFTESLPDIEMLSAELQAGNTVQFTYQTTGDPGPFEVGLFRSADGVNYDPAAPLGTKTVTPGASGQPATDTIAIPSPWNADPTKPFLVVVADPQDVISESNLDNNSRSIRLPDVAARSLAWTVVDSVVVGLDFTYEVQGAALSVDTTIALYWASGGTLLDKAFEISSDNSIGVYSTHVGLASLAAAPSGANRLIVLADPADSAHPSGLIPEAEEANNALSVPLYALNDSTVIITDAISARVAELAASFYLETRKVLVLTDGFRTPEQQALQILNSIKNEGIVATRRLYTGTGDGATINEILKVYDPNKSDADNLVAMTGVIVDQLTRPQNRPVISSHLLGRAFDISIAGLTRRDIAVLRQVITSFPGAVFKDETWRSVGPHIHVSFQS